MNKYLPTIPRSLNATNIDTAISSYLNLLEKIPLSVSSNNILTFLAKLKREPMDKDSPYPNVTLFEAANRIFTDLTILFGVQRLLKNEVAGICFDEYLVSFGNENNNPHDIIAIKGERKLIGEAFNVAQSFFQGKKSTALKKLRAAKVSNEIILIMFNADAVRNGYAAKIIENEYHVPVEIKLPALTNTTQS